MSSLPGTARKIAIVLAAGLLVFVAGSVAQAAPGIFGIHSLNCSTSQRCLQVSNEASGIGVYGFTQSGADGAVRGVAADTNGAGVGVWGVGLARGVIGEAANGPGVLGASDAGPGIRGVSEYGAGVTGNSATSFGVRGVSESAYGVSGHSYDYVGVHGGSSGLDITDYGGHFNSFRRGLYADGNNGYFDGYFPNCVRIGAAISGNCSTAAPYSAGLSVIAVNGGAEALAPGDVLVFKGMGAVDGVPDVVLLVDKAAGVPGEVLIGIMKEAYALEPVESVTLPSPAIPRDHPLALAGVELPPMPEHIGDTGRVVEGSAEPGGLLFVQIEGIARVNVDTANGAIIAGATLVAVSGGRAGMAPAPAPAEGAGSTPANLPPAPLIGRALESLDSGSGAVFVLLNAR